MKRISFRVAVAAAAIAAMAALTAGPASAGTVLCKTHTATCAENDIKPAGSQLHTANTVYDKEFGLTIKAYSGTKFHCREDLTSVTSTMRNGNPLPADFYGAVEADTCKDIWFPKTSCTSVTMNSPSVSLEATEESSTLEIGSESEPLSISFECNFGGEVEETCVYEATDAVTMELGQFATIKGAPLVKTAGESPSCSMLSGGLTLWVNNVEAGTSYLSQATETVLCGEVGAEADPCPNSEIEPAGTPLAVGAYNEYVHNLVIKQSGGGKSHECTNFGWGFDTTEEAGQPLEAEGSYGSVNSSSCTAFRFGKRTCSSATVNTPDATIEATGGGDAVVEAGTASQPLVLSLTCELGTESLDVCTYEATASVTIEVDGQERIVSIDDAPLKRVKGSFLTCGPETGMVLDMTAGYNFPHVEITSI